MRDLIMVEIDDITDTRPRSVQVIIKQTGKTAWLPREIGRRPVQFFRGRVYLPAWLAERMFAERRKEGI
jgi:hypothetical protein